ncbi:MAG: hypothetical protein JST06_08815 [Bacteroidetes bacterium]|nr:hypothetical protein [Bacteroidota bacterium]MBS1629930.1 hypothetical protein [Bacteroidota bacterium]
MRLISAILALLVLFLTVQPVCADCLPTPQTESCCDEGCAKEQTPSKGHEPEGHCKACNPFQSCGCCPGSVVVPMVSRLLPEAVVFDPATEEGVVVMHLVEAPVTDFWQPPRAV